MLDSPSRTLRPVALIEALTYLTLLATFAGRRLLGMGDVSGLIGPIHGVVFLAYVALDLMVRAERRWDGRTTLLAIGAAVVPFGGLLVERRLLRAGAPPRAPASDAR